MVTVQISEELWSKLNKDKNPGDSFHNKIDELYNIKDSLEREIRNAGKTNIIQISVLRGILENE